MFKKGILLLSIFIVCLLAVSAVAAADNATDDIVSLSDDNATVGLENSQDSLNESEVLKADSANAEPVLTSAVNNTVEVLSASSALKLSDDVLGAVSSDSSSAEPVLKAKKTKTVKMNVKFKWTTKKVGKYKIKARLWKVLFYGGYVNYLDIILYKNGKMCSCNAYMSKYTYKENGRWKWWPKWRHGGVNHSYHRYINDRPIKSIMVKFRYC